MRRIASAIPILLLCAGSVWAASSWPTNQPNYQQQPTTQGTAGHHAFAASQDRPAPANGKEIRVGDSGHPTLDLILADATVTAGTIVVPPGTQILSDSSNRTLVAGLTLMVLPGGMVCIPTGRTLTINGSLEAGLSQIFTGAGKVIFTGTSPAQVVPQWWGAKGDGITDDAEALGAAARSAGGRELYIPDTGLAYRTSKTIYVASNTVVRIHGKVKLKAGIGLPVFCNSEPQPGHTAKAVPTSPSYTQANIQFLGDGKGVIDGNAQNQGKKSPLGTATTDPGGLYDGALGPRNVDPYYRATCISLISVDGCAVEGLTIKDAAEWAVRFRNCRKVVFAHCTVNTGNGNGMSGTLAANAANGQNQDGVHFENCVDFTLHDCPEIQACDDCVSITAFGLGTGGLSTTGILKNFRTVSRTWRASDGYMAANGVRILRAGGAGTSDQDLTDIQIDNWTAEGYGKTEGGRAFCIGDNATGPGNNVIATRRIHINGVVAKDFTDTRVNFGDLFIFFGVADWSITDVKCDNFARKGIAIFNATQGEIVRPVFTNPLPYAGTDTSIIYANNVLGNVDGISIHEPNIADSYNNGILFAGSYPGVYRIDNLIIYTPRIYGANHNADANKRYDYAAIRTVRLAHVKILKGGEIINPKALGVLLDTPDDAEIDGLKVVGARVGGQADCHGIFIAKNNATMARAVVRRTNVNGCGGHATQITNALDVTYQDNQASINNLDGPGNGAEVYITLDNVGAVAAKGYIGGNSITGDNGTHSRDGIQIALLKGASSTLRLTSGQNNFANLTNWWVRATGSYSPAVEIRAPSGAIPLPDTIQGDVIRYTNAVAGGAQGEIGIASGTPGTRKAIAN